MKKTNIWEWLLREYETGWTIGPTLSMSPDSSGQRGQGARKNFQTVGHETEWPYDNDDEIHFGQPIGPQGLNRANGVGSDVHGGPQEPRVQYTWDGGPRDSDDDSDDEVDEAMGTPYNFGQGMKNGGGMGGSVPGMGDSFAHSGANFFSFDDDPENEPPHPPKLSDCFDPSPIFPEPVDNPDQEFLQDSTDEDLESKIDKKFGDFDDVDIDQHIFMEPGTDLGEPETIFNMPKLGAKKFSMSLDRPGAARGTYGMHPEQFDDALTKKSAWEEINFKVDGVDIAIKK